MSFSRRRALNVKPCDRLSLRSSVRHALRFIGGSRASSLYDDMINMLHKPCQDWHVCLREVPRLGLEGIGLLGLRRSFIPATSGG